MKLLSLNPMIFPMFFTLLRIVLAPITSYVLINYSANVMWITALIATAGLSDFLDGFLARQLNVTSMLGSILDPVADKIFIICMFIALYWINKLSLEVLSIFLVKDILLALGFFILGQGALANSVSPNPINLNHINPIMLSKVNTALQFLLMLGLVHNFSHVNYLLYTTVGTTIGSLVWYVFLFLK